MAKDKLIQALSAFIATKGEDRYLAELLPDTADFERRFRNLNHFPTAFAWSLEDWILESFPGDRQWEDLAETLSQADDDWTAIQWNLFFEDLDRKRFQKKMLSGTPT